MTDEITRKRAAEIVDRAVQSGTLTRLPGGRIIETERLATTNDMFYSACEEPCADPEHGLLHCAWCGSRPLDGWLCVSCTYDELWSDSDERVMPAWAAGDPESWRQFVRRLDVDPEGWVRLVLETSGDGITWDRRFIARGDEAVDALDALGADAQQHG